MNVNQLSNRLRTVAAQLPEGANFADIGSDHAYLPCYVCLRDVDANAIAGEINQGPYESAIEEVERQALTDRIDVRKGNGLEVLRPGEVGQIVLAGMGGPLMTEILREGQNKLTGVQRIIVQPNIEARAVRRWFLHHDYTLVHEEIIEESGHIYEVLTADKREAGTASEYQIGRRDVQLMMGPYLLEECTEVFKKKWRKELMKKQFVLEQMKLAKQPDSLKVNQLNTEINWIKEALDQ